MKTLAEINALHLEFERKYGYRSAGAEQQSEAWFNTKLGVVSASNISKVVAKIGSQTRHTYMCELISQITTGLQKEIKAIALDWGNQYEDAARAYYEAKAKVTATKIPFVFKDNSFREGCSSDFLVTATRGGEIKCPFDSTNFVKFVLDGDDIDPDYEKQVQHNMRCLGAEQWDFGMYDPRSHGIMLKFKTIDRDEKFQKTMDDAIPQFLHDLDKALLDGYNMKFGVQWLRLAIDQKNGKGGIFSEAHA